MSEEAAKEFNSMNLPLRLEILGSLSVCILTGLLQDPKKHNFFTSELSWSE